MWQWDARHSLRGLLLTAQLLAQTPALCCCTSHLSQSLHLIVSVPFNLCLFVPLSTLPSSFSTYLHLSFSLCLFVSPLSFSFSVSLFCLIPLSHLIFSLIFIGGLRAKGFLLWFYIIGLSKADQDNVILPLKYTRIGRITAGGKTIARFLKWVGGESGLNLFLFFLLRQQEVLWPWYKWGKSVISCWAKGLN